MKLRRLICRSLVTAAAAFLATTATTTIAFAADGPFHVEHTWQVGGEGGWDYIAVDPQSNLLYMTRGDHVQVANRENGKLVADITGLHRTHGVVFAAGGNGYISDGGGNQVAVFDRKTFKVIRTIPTGTNPDGILYEPVTRTVWAFNGRSNNVTVIDTKDDKVLATLELPGKPEFPVADGKGNVYDNIEDKSEIVHFDARSRKLLATWPIAPGESPSGLAIDRKHGILFSVCDNQKMAIVSTATGKVIATPNIGDGPDAARFSPEGGYAFSSNGESGTLTVVHEDSPEHFTVVQNLPTEKGARTMTLSPDGSKAYLVTAKFGARPASEQAQPHSRPPMIPGSFTVIVVGK
ncbi:MAG TPA: YncE family protein [Acidobacteriaceae bacterium]|nr:YncE family protein [Acidobacteriaceae bacterium]